MAAQPSRHHPAPARSRIPAEFEGIACSPINDGKMPTSLAVGSPPKSRGSEVRAGSRRLPLSDDASGAATSQIDCTMRTIAVYPTRIGQ